MLQAEVEVTAITQSLLFFAPPGWGRRGKKNWVKNQVRKKHSFFVLLA